jgi:hypothetical protein
MNNADIKQIFLHHGFTIKEGQSDLKQYVYNAAYALLAAADFEKAHHRIANCFFYRVALVSPTETVVEQETLEYFKEGMYDEFKRASRRHEALLVVLKKLQDERTKTESLEKELAEFAVYINDLNTHVGILEKKLKDLS